MEEVPKESNAKAYTMTIKEEESLLIVRQTVKSRFNCGV